jgi:hypothetical protein
LGIGATTAAQNPECAGGQPVPQDGARERIFLFEKIRLPQSVHHQEIDVGRRHFRRRQMDVFMKQRRRDRGIHFPFRIHDAGHRQRHEDQSRQIKRQGQAHHVDFAPAQEDKQDQSQDQQRRTSRRPDPAALEQDQQQGRHGACGTMDPLPEEKADGQQHARDGEIEKENAKRVGGFQDSKITEIKMKDRKRRHNKRVERPEKDPAQWVIPSLRPVSLRRSGQAGN